MRFYVVLCGFMCLMMFYVIFKPSEKKNWSASRTRICARFIQFLFEKTVAAQDPSKLIKIGWLDEIGVVISTRCGTIPILKPPYFDVLQAMRQSLGILLIYY